MPSKNISISDEAYKKMTCDKRLFSTIILLELRGTISNEEANDMRNRIEESREARRKQIEKLFERWK